MTQDIPTASPARLVAIEAGGTNINVAIGSADGRIDEQARIATRDPASTFADVTRWIDGAIARGGALTAIGIASFGPIDTDRASPSWGRLGMTPKPGWAQTNMIAPLHRFGVPLTLDTDVNGAALAEARWGAARDIARACYLTVGTGIGGGAVLNGQTLNGQSHPEMGHIPVRRLPQDEFAGCCPIHGDCLEGMASGTAIAARWGRKLDALPDDHSGHDIIAGYLAQACVAIVAILAPQRIVLGGGVLHDPRLVDRVRHQFAVASGGYFGGFAPTAIVRAGLFPASGLVGGLALAAAAVQP